MKLDPRVMLPAALAVIAVAIPSGSATADPPITYQCPDGYMLTPALAQPDKDKNNDFMVCMKTNGGGNTVYKDDNCQCMMLAPPYSTNPDDYVDDTIIQ